MHNHADFRELGVSDIAVKNGQTARMFDAIAQKGDQLTTWQKGYKTGVLRIIDSQL
jgi:spore maturation protein CgeB